MIRILAVCMLVAVAPAQAQTTSFPSGFTGVSGAAAVTATTQDVRTECTATLTLPEGDIPVPDNIDVIVKYAGGFNWIAGKNCKIVVRSAKP